MEKDLENLEVTELQEKAAEGLEINGAHAMKKDEPFEATEKFSGSSKKGKREMDKEPVVQKPDLKKKLRALKIQKETALENRDKKALKSIRIRIKKLKRKTRRLENTISGIS